MKTTLELDKWYQIRHLKQDNPKGYWGPAKYKGSGCGWEMFLLPEDLHREDEEEIYLLFAAKDVVGIYERLPPLNYNQLAERVKQLEELIDKGGDWNHDSAPEMFAGMTEFLKK